MSLTEAVERRPMALSTWSVPAIDSTGTLSTYTVNAPTGGGAGGGLPPAPVPAPPPPVPVPPPPPPPLPPVLVAKKPADAIWLPLTTLPPLSAIIFLTVTL